jgi:hypothetical protein
VLGALLLSTLAPATGAAAPLSDPPVFTSQRGVRLQLNPGDTPTIRLVNKLPPIPEAKHIADIPTLIGNPTNLTDEDHNFHIHQTRFRLLQGGTTPGTTLPSSTADGLVPHDNLPLPRAAVTDSCNGSTEAFLSGLCRPTTVVVEIPFHEIRDLVFHCHILEHEDACMMARIRVVAPRA